LQGSARSGPGVLQIDGRLSRLPARAAAAEGVDEGALQVELRVSGADFEVVNLPEARVLATPDLRCTLAGRGLVVDGTLLIPEARLEPRDLSAAVTPSRDALRVDAQLETPPGWEVRSHVQVSLGERVTFKGYGLSGQLTGALDIADEPGKQPRASGELAVRDGSYAAYGQTLKIEQGRVLYRDSPLDNPGLDVRATRKIETTEVLGGVLAGVRVLGTAQAPSAELYSQPALPQADVLSYLMLGRPLEGASGGEGELLIKAASSLGLKGGTRLAQSIGRHFGLDEVSFTSVEGVDGDREGTALRVGKYLSPRLYLNYSIGMLNAANQWQLRYRMTKHLSVQTETGEATGGDVLYTIER
jgi:translocation and assembly module TamB